MTKADFRGKNENNLMQKISGNFVFTENNEA